VVHEAVVAPAEVAGHVEEVDAGVHEKVTEWKGAEGAEPVKREVPNAEVVVKALLYTVFAY
jgi:hypothetical protein